MPQTRAKNIIYSSCIPCFHSHKDLPKEYCEVSLQQPAKDTIGRQWTMEQFTLSSIFLFFPRNNKECLYINNWNLMPNIQLWAFCTVKHICFNNLCCLKYAINSYREKENTQKSSNARRKQDTRSRDWPPNRNIESLPIVQS